MKTPVQYEKWLKKIKKEIDYDIKDEASFDVHLCNYQLMYSIFNKIKDNPTDKNGQQLYQFTTLQSQHIKFLEVYGLTGKAKLQTKILKKRIDEVKTDPKKDNDDDFLKKYSG